MESARAALPAPSLGALAHSARLHALIAGEIAAAGGFIGFDRYMQLALYAPGLGYYAAGARKFGDSATGGDFVTAPEISPLFGRALAAQVAQVLAQMTPGSAPQVLEFGAGSGALARDLLDELQARGVPLERYAIVEVSPDLRDRQRARLAAYAARGTVQWLDAPPDSATSGFEGVIVANEVLDVMPVRLFVMSEGRQVLERGVTLRDGALAFAERPADSALRAAVAAIEQETGALPAGYGSEVGEVARAWSASLGSWLARGVALLVDYGFPRREYYHPQRAMGTLMCHYRHHSHAEPLWLPGLNDITAHVDFTAVADAAHGAGLDVLGYTTQAHFLLNCGLLDLVQREQLTERGPQRAGEAQRLVSEAEMGELFKVLAAGRGIDVQLLGFSRGDRLHAL